MRDYNEKFWPYFVLWFDLVQSDAGVEATSICRSLDEANSIGYTRVLFGTKESWAAIYQGSVTGKAKKLHKIYWDGTEIKQK